MSKKKLFTETELRDLSAEEVIEKIKYENYSLLSSLGAENLRKEMVPVGKVCNSVVNYLFATSGLSGDNEKHNLAAQRKLVKTLSRIAPGSYSGVPKNLKHGLVVGFNHPSLGEIGRIMTMKIDLMGSKLTCFPVNLPWYEALAPNYDRIARLGFIITPTITPSTWKKMNLKEGTVLFEAGSRLKKEFRNLYTKTSHDIVKNGGVVFVAPSATRQATVFKNEEEYDGTEEIIPTMSMLALKLYSDPDMKCDFLPLAVLPPKNYKRGLNIRKKYRLIPGELMTAAYIRRKYLKEPDTKRLDGFDYDFHKRIAEKLPKKFWY
ncbi:hypothetical protein IKE99_02440 [Candidatus Saccharibacteria bacterium]|nr:hypothetical protein [Candidatus Saccharibacteria bacterium]